MPAKIDADANLRFLYVCFKHSNFTTIDYHKVAAHFQIKAPAARMRLMRLRMALEGESPKDHRGKRGRDEFGKGKGKGETYMFYDDDDDDEVLDNLPLADRVRLKMLIKREVDIKRESGWGEVKKEEEEDVTGRVKMEPFDHGSSFFKTEEGTEGGSRRSFSVKKEHDIKTEGGEASVTYPGVAYPAPFTFASTRPTFFNPFSQVKREPGFETGLGHETSFPGFRPDTLPGYGKDHQPFAHAQPNTTQPFSTGYTQPNHPQPNTPSSQIKTLTEKFIPATSRKDSEMQDINSTTQPTTQTFGHTTPNPSKDTNTNIDTVANHYTPNSTTIRTSTTHHLPNTDIHAPNTPLSNLAIVNPRNDITPQNDIDNVIDTDTPSPNEDMEIVTPGTTGIFGIPGIPGTPDAPPCETPSPEFAKQEQEQE